MDNIPNKADSDIPTHCKFHHSQPLKKQEAFTRYGRFYAEKLYCPRSDCSYVYIVGY